MALTRCSRVVKSEILDSDRTHVRNSSNADEPADRVMKLRVPVKARPKEVERDTRWLARRVASSVHHPAGEMIGVEVDGHDSVGYSLFHGYGQSWCAGPRGVQVPPTPLRTEPDGIGDGSDGDLRGPLHSTMLELHQAGQSVPPMRSVREVAQRSRQDEVQFSCWMDPDGGPSRSAGGAASRAVRPGCGIRPWFAASPGCQLGGRVAPRAFVWRAAARQHGGSGSAKRSPIDRWNAS
jgi:hypothetical protein